MKSQGKTEGQENQRLGRVLRTRLLSLIQMAIRQSTDDLSKIISTNTVRRNAPAKAVSHFNPSDHAGLEPIDMGGVDSFDNKAKASALAPRIFRELRSIFNISSESFMASLEEQSTERFTEGRSGAFMYFSCDNRFIIKTATEGEWNVLVNMLPNYYEHTVKNPDSLINRIVGAFELHYLNHTTRVIMIESCFPPGQEVHVRYDLKGSWIGRSSKKEKEKVLPWERDYENTSHFKVKGVLKDLDLHSPLLLPRDVARRLGEQLRSDIEFLGCNGIMDYSILLGVTKASFPIRGEDRKDIGLSCVGVDSVEGPHRYSIGLIDVLQDFNFRKRAEFFFKRYIQCLGPGISVHPPPEYAERMIENVVEALIERVAAKHVDEDEEESDDEKRGCCGVGSSSDPDEDEEDDGEQADLEPSGSSARDLNAKSRQSNRYSDNKSGDTV